MFELKYDDGWYVCQNGLAVFRFENGDSEAGFAQWVVDTLNAQSVQADALYETVKMKYQCPRCSFVGELAVPIAHR